MDDDGLAERETQRKQKKKTRGGPVSTSGGMWSFIGCGRCAVVGVLTFHHDDSAAALEGEL